MFCLLWQWCFLLKICLFYVIMGFWVSDAEWCFFGPGTWRNMIWRLTALVLLMMMWIKGSLPIAILVLETSMQRRGDKEVSKGDEGGADSPTRTPGRFSMGGRRAGGVGDQSWVAQWACFGSCHEETGPREVTLNELSRCHLKNQVPRYCCSRLASATTRCVAAPRLGTGAMCLVQWRKASWEKRNIGSGWDWAGDEGVLPCAAPCPVYPGLIIKYDGRSWVWSRGGVVSDLASHLFFFSISKLLFTSCQMSMNQNRNLRAKSVSPFCELRHESCVLFKY